MVLCIMTKTNFSYKAQEILKARKLNCTGAQIVVLEELLKADKPFSREEIAARLGKYCPDKVTIYRILEKFCKTGLVHKAYLQKRAWHYELANHCGEKQCHPHFFCGSCGETYCLLRNSVPIIKGLKKGFIVKRQQVRIEGLCPACS
jgi:Fur family ferric uptake transcriptional regulator